MLILKKMEHNRKIAKLERRLLNMYTIKDKIKSKGDFYLFITIILTSILTLILFLSIHPLFILVLLFNLFLYFGLSPIEKKKQQFVIINHRILKQYNKEQENTFSISENIERYYEELIILKKENRLNELSNSLIDDILDEVRKNSTNKISKNEKIDIFINNEQNIQFQSVIEND